RPGASMRRSIVPLTTNEPALVVVGAGQAGAHAAMAAREHGFAGRVTVIGDEHVLPYERPPLSKEVLRGEAEPASARVAHAERYDSLGIEVRTGARVQAIDRPGQRVVLADGSSIPYVALVLATGAEPNRLPVQGAHLHGVHHLRTLDDSIAIRDALRSAARAAVVGAGWIGSEVAA